MKSTEIIEKMCQIEKEFNLFERKIDNIYFWKVIRFNLYHKILLRIGVINSFQHPQSKLLLLKRGFLNIVNSLSYSCFKKTHKTDILIFETPRFLKSRESVYDPYTKYIVEELIAKNSNFRIIDDGINGVHTFKANSIRCYGENFIYDIIVRSWLALICRFSLNKDDYNFLNLIQERIYDLYEFKIDLISIVKKDISYFKYQYYKYEKLFSIMMPNKIYFVCSYGKEGIIQAAKNNNIEVIEIQHGLHSKNHVGYYFQEHKKVPYFPDKFLMHGKFWYDYAPLPLAEEHVSYIGYTDLRIKQNSLSHINKIKNSVLIISQATIKNELFKKALEVAEENPNYTVTYKLHPAEIEYWKDTYKDLIFDLNISNFKIDFSGENIYQSLASSEFVIGVYSTAMVEALMFDCTVIVLDLYGVDDMLSFIEGGYVTLIRIDEKITFSQQRVNNTSDKGYFF